MRKTVILGCGGHGRVILDILRTIGADGGVLFVDDREALHDTCVDGTRVTGGSNVIRSGDHVYLGVGDNIVRGNLYDRLSQLGCVFPRLIAPSAIVSSRSIVEEGAVVLHRAVIQTGAHVGRNVIINTGAVVEHDCTVAAHAQLAPMASLSGNVHVGRGALLGTGCSVNCGVVIGEYALISPGLSVIRSVPDGTVCKLVPTTIIMERNYRAEMIADSELGEAVSHPLQILS